MILLRKVRPLFGSLAAESPWTELPQTPAEDQKQLFPGKPKLQVFLQHAAEIRDVHLAFTTDQHEIAVRFEVAVPLDDLLVGPGGIVLVRRGPRSLYVTG